MGEYITSVHNQRIKDAARLRDHRGRLKQHRVIIDGTREIARAHAAGVELLEVFRVPSTGAAGDNVIAELQAAGIQVTDVTAPVFEKLAFGDRSDGVVAIANTPSRTLNDLLPPKGVPIAVLEGVEKPGNLGAVVRSADGAGIGAVIVADSRTELFNPNAIRASLGSFFAMPLAQAPTSEVISWLRASRYRMIAARVDGAQPYTDVDLTGPVAIVLGSEANGLSQQWNATDVTSIKLPMLGVNDSLNVSATAAVLFYEALRQRETRVNS